MRRTLFLSVISAMTVFGLIGCDGNTSNNAVTTNTNRTTTNANANANANTAVVVNNNSMNANANREVSGSSSNDFMMKAAQGGMSEVKLGELAAKKAQSAEVKQFGQRMVTDHTKANNDLKAVAAKKSVTLPSDVNAEQKEMMDKLSKLSGAEFDKEYVKGMVEDHEKDVDEFQKQSENGSDADVKAFATRTLPTLKSHLEMIKNIQGKMK